MSRKNSRQSSIIALFTFVGVFVAALIMNAAKVSSSLYIWILVLVAVVCAFIGLAVAQRLK